MFFKLLQQFRKETLLTYFNVNKQIFKDAQKAGLKAISAPSVNIRIKDEQNYAKVDLETMTVDYNLCCFYMYLCGSSHKNINVTNHLSL